MKIIYSVIKINKSTLKNSNNKKNVSSLWTQDGLTLIEIIISLALIMIIVVPFLSIFVHSTSTNNKSENIIEGTTLAQTTMEELYSYSRVHTFHASLAQLVSKGFAETVIDPNLNYNYSKNQEGYYIKIELSKSVASGNLVNTSVKIYNNNSMEKLESQMETILLWKD